jgi:hypothetical protein
VSKIVPFRFAPLRFALSKFAPVRLENSKFAPPRILLPNLPSSNLF